MSSRSGKDMIRLVAGAGRRKRQKKKRKGEKKGTVGLPLPRRRRPTVLHTATRRNLCRERGSRTRGIHPVEEKKSDKLPFNM